MAQSRCVALAAPCNNFPLLRDSLGAGALILLCAFLQKREGIGQHRAVRTRLPSARRAAVRDRPQQRREARISCSRWGTLPPVYLSVCFALDNCSTHPLCPCCGVSQPWKRRSYALAHCGCRAPRGAHARRATVRRPCCRARTTMKTIISQFGSLSAFLSHCRVLRQALARRATMRRPRYRARRPRPRMRART